MSYFVKVTSNKIFILAGLCLLIFLAVVGSKQFRAKKLVQQEIANLNAQSEQIQSKNRELLNLISYLKTDDYKQKAAREQLNLKKEGEHVYSFAPDIRNQAIEIKSGNENSAQISNPKKWWNYFFKHNNL